MVKAIGDFYVKRAAEGIVTKLSDFVKEWKVALKATKDFPSLGMKKVNGEINRVKQGKDVVKVYTLANTSSGAVDLRYIVWERLSNGAY